MKLQGFDYVVKHIPGKSNVSDYISRHVDVTNLKATKEEKEIEEYVHAIIRAIPNDTISLEDIRKEVENDALLSKLKELIQNDRNINKNDNSFGKFKTVYKELYIAEGLILRNNRIIIPNSLQESIIRCGLEDHQGIVKKKELLRSKYWWLGMTSQINTTIAKCKPCQASVPHIQKEPLKMSALPNGPWAYVATYFHRPFTSGEYLLNCN